jgi:hypothetical protein
MGLDLPRDRDTHSLEIATLAAQRDGIVKKINT